MMVNCEYVVKSTPTAFNTPICYRHIEDDVAGGILKALLADQFLLESVLVTIL